MTADGERVAGRSAGDTARRDAGRDGDAPLADLTAGGLPPLADLGADDGVTGDASSDALPDLTAGDGVVGQTPDDADDDWAPVVPPAAAVVPTAAAAAGDGGDAEADWQPLPDLADRRTTKPRGRRGGRRADERAAPAAAAPSAPESDGLPPGALGAGASGPHLGVPKRVEPDADDDAPRSRRKGSRRRGRRGAEAAAGEGAVEGAEAEPERPLTAEERLQQALTLAYRHLSKRDRTVSEVRAHLEKREIDEPSIVGALAELVEFGYVDDERYAARFVEDKRRLEGWGHLRIEQGLRRTGIPRETADRALADDPLRGEEDDLAVDALERRLNGRALEDDRARQKALRLLATKGYPLETAYAAVRTYERRCAERDED